MRLEAEGELADDLEAGAALIAALDGVAPVAGDEIGIGEGDEREVRRVAEVAEAGVELELAVELAHAAGSQVALRRRYEVLAVEDEAGQGHHRRVVVRRMG